MNLRFQYNKTSLQSLDKQLQVRIRALPTLKNKESALRMEVKAARKRAMALSADLERVLQGQDDDMKMWVEFEPSLIRVSEVRLSYHKIAGVEIPELEQVIFDIREFDVYVKPKWFLDGIAVTKDLLKLVLESRIMERKQKLLEYARRKTTQKVNLYEKVQIPAYHDAIRKIKRYLEDEDNLAKAAQKIVKNRQQEKTEAIL